MSESEASEHVQESQDDSMDVYDSSSSEGEATVPLLQDIERICCIGGGRVGILSMLVLSHYWHDKVFVVVDDDVNMINDLNGLNNENEVLLPFSEPGMAVLLQAATNRGNLHFSFDIENELDLCQMVFIAVDIPLKTKPKVIKNDLDIKNFEDAIRSILLSIDRTHERKFIAVKSTMPVDYKNHIHNHIDGYGHPQLLSMIINPEFFSVGTAVQDLLHPPKVVLGSFFRGDNALPLFRELYEVVVDHFDDVEVINSLNSVQIGKLLSNAALASQLALMNIGSTLCEKVGSDYDDVRRTMSAHPRLNQSFTSSKPGYGGLGLTKDVDYLAYLCDCVGMTNQKKFFTMLSEMRVAKMDELVRTISHMIGDSKNIAIYGFSNKLGTSDIRESPAIYLCQSLLKINQVELMIYDPVVLEDRILECFTARQRAHIKVVDNVQDAWDVEAMVFLVEWLQFAEMLQNNLGAMIDTMRRPSIIFDCCNLITEVTDAFQPAQVYRLGKPV